MPVAATAPRIATQRKTSRKEKKSVRNELETRVAMFFPSRDRKPETIRMEHNRLFPNIDEHPTIQGALPPHLQLPPYMLPLARQVDTFTPLYGQTRLPPMLLKTSRIPKGDPAKLADAAHESSYMARTGLATYESMSYLKGLVYRSTGVRPSDEMVMNTVIGYSGLLQREGQEYNARRVDEVRREIVNKLILLVQVRADQDKQRRQFARHGKIPRPNNLYMAPSKRIPVKRYELSLKEDRNSQVNADHESVRRRVLPALPMTTRV